MIRKTWRYFKTHYIASFVLLVSAAILVMIMLLLGYINGELFSFLREESYNTEEAVMESVQKNVDYAVRSQVKLGSEMATENKLYSLTKKEEEARFEGKNVTNAYLNLHTYLSKYEYPQNVVASAVAGSEGLICQYDKYRNYRGMDGTLWNQDNRDVLKGIIKKLQEGTIFPRYVAFTEPEIHPRHYEKRLYHIAFPLTGGETSVWKAEYVLILSFDMQYFEEFLETVEVPKAEYVNGYVTDAEGKIFYINNEDYLGKKESSLPKGVEYLTITKPLKYFGWSLNLTLDQSELHHHINLLYGRGLNLYIVLVLIYISVMIFWLSRLIRPVRSIFEAIRAVEAGEYHKRIAIGGQHEIWKLADEYNKMAEVIESRDREIELQHKQTLISIEQKHQAEWEALESQINAHFICNTLGSISYEAIEAGDHKVSILIKKLSNMLRYTFDQKCQEVFLSQEMAWIDQYLYLQKTRYETKFDYQIDFPEVYNQWPCCKLMLQPFVENSLMHGFEKIESGGFIHVLVSGEGNRLKLCIRDNGCGIDPSCAVLIQEMLQGNGCEEFAKDTGFGIGIRNVVTRLKMYYGDQLEVFLETELGKGTAFTFLLPIPQKKLDQMIEKKRWDKNEGINCRR